MSERTLYLSCHTHHMSERTIYMSCNTCHMSKRTIYMSCNTRHMSERTHYMSRNTHHMSERTHYNMSCNTHHRSKRALYIACNTRHESKRTVYMSCNTRHTRERTLYMTCNTRHLDIHRSWGVGRGGVLSSYNYSCLSAIVSPFKSASRLTMLHTPPRLLNYVSNGHWWVCVGFSQTSFFWSSLGLKAKLFPSLKFWTQISFTF
jgi:hypothetical protein